MDFSLDGGGEGVLELRFFFFFFPGMGCLSAAMVAGENLGSSWFCRRSLGFLHRVVLGLWVGFLLWSPVVGLRPLRERARSWGDEVGFLRIREFFAVLNSNVI